jgi:hypothetical protein
MGLSGVVSEPKKKVGWYGKNMVKTNNNSIKSIFVRIMYFGLKIKYLILVTCLIHLGLNFFYFNFNLLSCKKNIKFWSHKL